MIMVLFGALVCQLRFEDSDNEEAVFLWTIIISTEKAFPDWQAMIYVSIKHICFKQKNRIACIHRPTVTDF